MTNVQVGGKTASVTHYQREGRLLDAISASALTIVCISLSRGSGMDGKFQDRY